MKEEAERCSPGSPKKLSGDRTVVSIGHHRASQVRSQGRCSVHSCRQGRAVQGSELLSFHTELLPECQACPMLSVFPDFLLIPAGTRTQLWALHM